MKWGSRLSCPCEVYRTPISHNTTTGAGFMGNRKASFVLCDAVTFYFIALRTTFFTAVRVSGKWHHYNVAEHRVSVRGLSTCKIIHQESLCIGFFFWCTLTMLEESGHDAAQGNRKQATDSDEQKAKRGATSIFRRGPQNRTLLPKTDSLQPTQTPLTSFTTCTAVMSNCTKSLWMRAPWVQLSATKKKSQAHTL